MKRGPAGTRPAARAAALALCCWLAACDQFSATGVAERCVAAALKSGEPYGSARERQATEAQLRQFCLAAAQGR